MFVFLFIFGGESSGSEDKIVGDIFGFDFEFYFGFGFLSFVLCFFHVLLQIKINDKMIDILKKGDSSYKLLKCL